MDTWGVLWKIRTLHQAAVGAHPEVWAVYNVDAGRGLLHSGMAGGPSAPGATNSRAGTPAEASRAAAAPAARPSSVGISHRCPGAAALPAAPAAPGSTAARAGSGAVPGPASSRRRWICSARSLNRWVYKLVAIAP